ncbi:MAG: PadR family transcriptional regulator [Methanocalculaceae archaeon]|jgi:DNA-binding PadR family transcriptional regulator|nr:PadR family transcriptional regulator [Methanocalculaceae archaeon]
MQSTEKSPLTEAAYYILLSLYSPLHGYGIMQKVREMSNDRVHLGAGTLYGAISTLLDRQWIASVGDSAVSRKKEYIITDAGRAAVKNEILRLRELIENGKRMEKL